MIKPITPAEVTHQIPDFIIDAVNKLITEKWDGETAKVYQDEIMDIVSSNDPDDPRPAREEVFDHHWLDFEDMYRKVGWTCNYFKPPYYEDWKPYFIFTKK